MAPDGSPRSKADGPLSGRRVVVTRSVADNLSLGGVLSGLGAEVVRAPMAEILPPTDGGLLLRSAIERLEDYRYVVLTSANGVAAVAEAMADRPWPSSVRVVPVGPATENAALEAGMAVDPPPSEATAACLVAEFEPLGEDGPCQVLAPLAELAGDVVADGLAAKGYVVDRVEAYRTAVPSSGGDEVDRMITGRIDAILFFSPSAVDRFIDQVAETSGLSIPDDCVTVCVGPTTASRATARAAPNVVVADPHTEHGVVAALVSALA